MREICFIVINVEFALTSKTIESWKIDTYTYFRYFSVSSTKICFNTVGYLCS